MNLRLAAPSLLPALAAFPAAAIELPPVSIPKVAAHAVTAEAFAPAGWKVEYRAEGDLNGDGLPDLALVLRDEDPANVVPNDGFGPDRFDTNPRLLLVVFRSPGGGYDLAATDDRLIARPDNPSQDDVMGDAANLQIARGALKVRLDLFMNAGGWTAGSATFAFRWQQGRFRLIGYDAAWTARNTGAYDKVSVNYLTGVWKSAKHGAGRLGANAPIWLGDIADGLAFQAEDRF